MIRYQINNCPLTYNIKSFPSHNSKYRWNHIRDILLVDSLCGSVSCFGAEGGFSLNSFHYFTLNQLGMQASTVRSVVFTSVWLWRVGFCSAFRITEKFLVGQTELSSQYAGTNLIWLFTTIRKFLGCFGAEGGKINWKIVCYSST